MKFLSKDPTSAILSEGLTYVVGNAARNKKLRGMLAREQKGFCAYTEKYLVETESVDVEHFDPALKGHDNYYSYYAVIHSVNNRKPGRDRFADAGFFESRFFQSRDEFDKRIRFVREDNVYDVVDPDDREAQRLIEFLGFNHHDVAQERTRHIKLLADIASNLSEEQLLSLLLENRKLLSFATAIEAKLGIDLSALL